MKKIAILLNPTAGKGRAGKKQPTLEKHLKKHQVPYDLFITKSEENLRKLTHELSEKFEILVGAGGDSTLTIMINELTKIGADNLIGMISLGSSNDIAKEYALGTLEKACLALKKQRIKSIDLGAIMLEDKILSLFLGQVSFGLGVTVNKHVEELIRTVPAVGKRQGLAGTLGVIDAYRTHKIPIELTIESDKGRIEGEYTLAVFSNSRFWASGMLVLPQALPDDGLMDSCLIRHCSFSRLAVVALLASGGKHVNLKEVEFDQSEGFTVTSKMPFELQADGELIGGYAHPKKFTSVRFETMPKALKLIY